ncbi:type II secretion system secretin GspD [Gallaecimonas kandeliae]|uniref:type II secretion system secretin GspD n=1 Tax=Gallaecimonas kandeliae TaxID=3029055 RepID=UPI002648EDC4|nr:type II secretion system secretin GspD [Gallaecimonas kandeliae]WKE65663.1 type II secretion system secretin GspD [Gallaecimonas kandeliae]
MTCNSTPKQLLVVLLGSLLLSCAWSPGGEDAADNPWRSSDKTQPQPAHKKSLYDQAKMESRENGTVNLAKPQQTVPNEEIYRGTGAFVNLAPGPSKQGGTAEGDVTLNFQGTDIGEVVKTVLGDILHQNYSVDPAVQGTVNLQTSKPISKDALVPTLEALLKANGAALLQTNGLYRVVPADGVAAGLAPKLKLSADRGYQMMVVPLRYIAAKEMVKLLDPIKPRQGVVQPDERRNLLILAGTQADLVNLTDTIKLFDVDQLQGMSVGLFRLQSVEPSVITSELEAIFGDAAEGPLAGMVRFLPIERLNALLVITPQEKYVKDARTWIERLDRAENPRGLNMYVYYVQNGKAQNLADMLSNLFEGQRRNQRNKPKATETMATPSPASTGADTKEASKPKMPASTPAAMDASNLDVGEVSIIADDETNALLVMATPADYEKVSKAIQKLDVLPLQVLVEATIVEVTLEDDLRYGLQWYFTNKLGQGRTGRGSLGSLPIQSPTDFAASASYEVFSAAGTKALLSTLASDSKVNVVSSPTLMVLDNHTATIRVGDQVPVRTSQTTNTSSDLGNITSTIQFKDTGVMLEVTPRVNAGGMVVLDITQEVNDVAKTTTSDIDSPTITQRRIATSVAVQSGETLVLGGLIRDNKTQDSDGVPGLRHIPILGWLFGSKGTSSKRTELVVMITPTAVADKDDAREVTDEYRRKLKGVDFKSLGSSY